MKRIGISVLSASLIVIGSTALAQQQPSPAPGGQSAQQQGEITADQAVEIARKQGLVNVKEIERDDRRWEVEGTDENGREIEVEVDLRTGEVIDVERG
jgi:uncharacterized membrane protein YkoI